MSKYNEAVSNDNNNIIISSTEVGIQTKNNTTQISNILLQLMSTSIKNVNLAECNKESFHYFPPREEDLYSNPWISVHRNDSLMKM